MLATIAEETLNPMTLSNPKTRKVCFSYAAYAKNVIDHLKSINIQVEQGLSEVEFCSIEAIFNFKFPPDLCSILQEGLPISPGFPNWRSSSAEQLAILKNLPILGLCRKVSRHNFWIDSWGTRPSDDDQAVNLGKRFLTSAPVLVPIYQYFYIPCTPCLAGNPVFYVNNGEIKLWSFDISGFFQQVDFQGNEVVLRRPNLKSLLNAPSWAATEARKIEFWTDLVENERRAAMPNESGRNDRGWWNEDLEGCFEEVVLRLREGGWKEEDIREMMMMMMDDGDKIDRHSNQRQIQNLSLTNLTSREGVAWHLRLLSKRLLRAGWSKEDVLDSLGNVDVYCPKS